MLIPATAADADEVADILDVADLAPEPAPVEAEAAASAPAFDPANANAPAEKTEAEEGETPPSPDDPGVDPDDAGDKESRRFRLF